MLFVSIWVCVCVYANNFFLKFKPYGAKFRNLLTFTTSFCLVKCQKSYLMHIRFWSKMLCARQWMNVRVDFQHEIKLKHNNKNRWNNNRHIQPFTPFTHHDTRTQRHTRSHNYITASKLFGVAGFAMYLYATNAVASGKKTQQISYLLNGDKWKLKI